MLVVERRELGAEHIIKETEVSKSKAIQIQNIQNIQTVGKSVEGNLSKRVTVGGKSQREELILRL